MAFDWASLAGGAIGAIGSLFGGSEANQSNRKMMERQMAFQREFAQHGLRWRIEDAQRAGVHPLYAVGANPATATPVAIADSMGPAISEAGQHIGRAVAAQSSVAERKAQALQLRLLEQQVEDGDLRLEALRSQRVLQSQPGMQTFPVINEQDTLNTLRGMTEITPTNTPTSSAGDPSVMAGTTPLWREILLAPGLPMLIPGDIQGNSAEALETLGESIPMFLAALQESERRYGPQWTDKMVERYFGPGGLQIRRGMQWLRSPDRLKDAERIWSELKRGQHYKRGTR